MTTSVTPTLFEIGPSNYTATSKLVQNKNHLFLVIYHECTKDNCHSDYPSSSPKQNHLIWDHANIPFFTKVILITRYVSINYQSSVLWLIKMIYKYKSKFIDENYVTFFCKFVAIFVKFFQRLGFTLISVCVNLK